MQSNGYVPPAQSPQRHRRSERAAEPSSHQNQETWNGVQPGRQGYRPQRNSAAAGYAAQPAVNPAPSQPYGYGQQPVYQNGAYAQQEYQGGYQTYGYQEQPRQNGYGGYYAPVQGAQHGYSGGQYPQGGYDPNAYYHQNQRQQGGSGGGKPPKKRHVLRAIIVSMLCLAILAGAGAVGYQYLQERQVEEYVAPYNNVFCQNVYVDGIHLGGMTAEEGIAAVQAKAQQRNDAWSVQLTYQGQLVTEIKASHLGMTVDVMDVMNEAWQQGHTGDIHDRKAAMEALLVTPYQGYTAMPGGDTSVIDSTLQTIRNQVYRAPQDARLESFDPERTTNPFTFQEEVPGRILDTEPVKEQLYQMVSTMTSGSIELTPTEIAPTVTVEQLQKLVTLRATAYTPISTSSTNERNNNIRRAFQQISGTVIMPGEKFSFNDVVGERTTDNGFYEAIEYAYGEHVMGVGGGVCQASSTVYQAAVLAGLEIVKREPHSDEVNYAEYGKDATVYWMYGRKIDFVFRNNTDSPIYMVAAVQSSPEKKSRLVARVSIYGADLGNVSYGLETQTVEVLQPGEDEIVKDKKGEYVTYTDEEYVQRKAAEGYVVDSYRVTYVDGVETERTHLYTDRYEAKAKRIYVGVKQRDD